MEGVRENQRREYVYPQRIAENIQQRSDGILNDNIKILGCGTVAELQ